MDVRNENSRFCGMILSSYAFSVYFSDMVAANCVNHDILYSYVLGRDLLIWDINPSAEFGPRSRARHGKVRA